MRRCGALRTDPRYPLSMRIDRHIRGAGRPDDAEPGLPRDLHGKDGRGSGGDDRRNVGDQAPSGHLRGDAPGADGKRPGEVERGAQPVADDPVESVVPVDISDRATMRPPSPARTAAPILPACRPR